MPRGIAGSGSGAARSGTMASAPLSGTTATAATMERASPSAGTLWTQMPYRFTVQNGGLIIQMQLGNSWVNVPIQATNGGNGGTATNGITRPARTRTRAARSGTTAAKTTTVSRA